MPWAQPNHKFESPSMHGYMTSPGSSAKVYQDLLGNERKSVKMIVDSARSRK